MFTVSEIVRLEEFEHSSERRIELADVTSFPSVSVRVAFPPRSGGIERFQYSTRVISARDEIKRRFRRHLLRERRGRDPGDDISRYSSYVAIAGCNARGSLHRYKRRCGRIVGKSVHWHPGPRDGEREALRRYRDDQVGVAPSVADVVVTLLV